MSHSFDLIPMKRYEVERLQRKLSRIDGLARLIESYPMAAMSAETRARLIRRSISEISELMGWHTEAAEIREVAVASKNEPSQDPSESFEGVL